MAQSPDRIASIIYLTVTCLLLLILFPLVYSARRVRWQYYGKYDRLRTFALQTAIICFMINQVFSIAENTWQWTHPDARNLNLSPDAATTIFAIDNLAQMLSQIFLAMMWFRTAISITHLLSATRRPQLLKWTRIVTLSIFTILALSGIAEWALNIWAQRIYYKEYQPDPLTPKARQASIRSNILGLVFVVLGFIYTVAVLPVVLFQVMGRRMDRIALFYLLCANSFIDMEILFAMWSNINFLRNNAVNQKASLAFGIATLALQVASYWMLAKMGRRDPNKLLDEGEERGYWHQMQESKIRLVELSADCERKDPAELPVKDNLYHQLEGSEIHELPTGKEMDTKDGEKNDQSSERNERPAMLRINGALVDVRDIIRRFMT